MADTRTGNSKSTEPGVESIRPESRLTDDGDPRTTTREPVGSTTRQATTTKPVVHPQSGPRTNTDPGISDGTSYREPTLGELFTGLSEDLTTLMRKELELAKTEMQENARTAIRAGVTLTISGFLGYAGLILALIAASIALGDALDNLWLGTGIVALVVLVIAGILYGVGKSKLNDVDLAPREAAHSVEKDVEMAKEKLS